MCGITGILNKRSGSPDQRLLQRMISTLRHRGPDDSGVYVNGPVGLAHSRLSIIDLETGQQPMSNEDGTLWITFNGEIFNYLELREKLEAKGHQFSTKSDTEVIVHSYEEKGEHCVSDFNGQWALALWDDRQKRLFLSRDRMGIRPLYYAELPDQFLFGSEIKALLQSPDVSREIDPEGLDQIFTVWGTIPPVTALKSVKELPPGHSMLVNEQGVKIWSHWELAYDELETSVEEAAERLLELLIDATRLRLRADVSVGAYLSGGLDSSFTAALVKNFTSSELETFSVTFDNPEFDESAFQDEVVDRLGVNHQRVRCSCIDIGRVFPDVIRHTEKPILRTAPAPLFLLSELVNSGNYKVVVTGEGADEVMGGYDLFKESKIRRFWARYPDSRLRPLLLKRLYPYLTNIQNQSTEYLKSFFHINGEDLKNPLFSHLPRWRLTSHLKLFLSREVRTDIDGYRCLDEIAGALPKSFRYWSDFAQAQFLETSLLLPAYILSSQGDRVSMAHSVEGRFPFLDHRVVEFAASLPPKLKMKGLTEKYILKKIASDYIPASVVKRPKQPYRAPEGASFFDFETGQARFDYVDELLSQTALREYGIFNPAPVGKLVEKVRNGRAAGIRDNMAIVGILSTQLFQNWLETA